MGIVVLFVAVLPAFGVGGRLLFQGEVPGPIKDSMTPRIKETAGIFWKIYFFLTMAEVSILWFSSSKMTFYDALTVSMSTLSTGGFSIHGTSIAYYESVLVEWIVIVFMVLGGVNFIHYVYCLRRKFYRLFEPELGIYLLTLVGFSICVTFYLFGTTSVSLIGARGEYSFSEALRSAFFQVISAQTSTGFSSVDFSFWPFIGQVVMLGVMYLGGMAGSTAGGIKMIRHYLMLNILKRRVEHVFRPEVVRKIRVSGSVVGESVQSSVMSFIVLVIVLSFIGTAAYVVNGVDPRTAMTVNACMINNIGLAFGMAGPASSFAFLPIFSKLLSCAWMMLGRLEFFVILILFIPGFWKLKA
jgi:trk system potassium uptake protein TrkH